MVPSSNRPDPDKVQPDDTRQDCDDYFTPDYYQHDGMSVQAGDDAMSDSSDESDDYDQESDVDDEGNPRFQNSKNSDGHSSDLGLKDDNRLVKTCKIIIFLLIGLLAFASALTTTFLVRKNENESFDDHANGFGQAIANHSQANLDRAFVALRSLGRTISGHATPNTETTNGPFPFVTLPKFEVYGEETRQLAGAEVVLYAPVVYSSNLAAWESYSSDNQGWIAEGLAYQGDDMRKAGSIPKKLHTRQELTPLYDPGEARQRFIHLPIWQVSPAPRNATIVNLDLVADDALVAHDVIDVSQMRVPLLSSVRDLNYLTEYSVSEQDDAGTTESEEKAAAKFNPISLFVKPQQSYILQPIFDKVWVHDTATGSLFTADSASVVGLVIAVIKWETLFSNILSSGVERMDVVVNDGCSHVFTISVQGTEARIVGTGDLHDVSYDSYLVTVNDFGGLVAAGFDKASILHPTINGTTYNDRYEGSPHGHCKYTLHIYPTTELHSFYSSDKALYPVAVVLIFIAVVILLCLYDSAVIGRQRRLLEVVKRTNEIVSSFFPKEVRERMMALAVQKDKANMIRQHQDNEEELYGDFSQAEFEAAVRGDITDDKPIADYFPSATLIFADIVGFTAWSSTREPSQVFKLLEAIFHAFDEIAKKRRIFKVETVGDCYVAASGLPERRNDHAVAMARFARESMVKFTKVVRKMEVELGPDTADLQLRVGIHSGPVTAGVLRGERSRFQLFGDSVNTASRVESCGAPSKIHVSKETADMLIQAGKKQWVTRRMDTVVAKGKGELETYWLEMKPSRAGSSSANTSASASDATSSAAVEEADEGIEVENHLSEKMQRLIKWNSELLVSSLKQIIARRDPQAEITSQEEMRRLERESVEAYRSGHLVFDEIVDVINLPPKSEANGRFTNLGNNKVELSSEVQIQLYDYVRTISVMYHDENPFHNFEHASHVAMSTSKLLARIIVPEEETGGYALRRARLDDESIADSTGCQDLHDNTYGITSDPLTQFTAILSAIVHDVDHPGVPNMTLINEKSELAVAYENKSVAEQNSVFLAWELLMDPSYEAVRRLLYTNKAEFQRFRQLLVNIVMATDIMDKSLSADRKERWNKAFAEEAERTQSPMDANRKATIVLEHLIQASDVSHTMQHWHIYRKWNERLFNEMYLAYLQGRSDKNPSGDWYTGEKGFFDFYIIPLAKKLESCGVFGVSSDEYLAYALKNRQEWEEKGQELVAEYLERFREKYGETRDDILERLKKRFDLSGKASTGQSWGQLK